MTASQFIASVQSTSRDFFRNLDRGQDALLGVSEPTTRDADTSFHHKQAVVKVSDLFAALHLAAAKWTCRAYPEYLKKRVEGFVIKNTGRAISFAAAKTLARDLPGIGWVAQIFSAGWATAEDAAEAVIVENLIREAIGSVRKEFNARACLKQTKVRGRVRNVRTRHRTKVKRRGRPPKKAVPFV